MKNLLLVCLAIFLPLKALSQADQRTPRAISTKTLTERWELDEQSQRGTFQLTSYKPFFINVVKWSNNPNQLPQSENPIYSATEELDLKSYEATFQLSFKSKIAQSIFGGKGDIWLAFTQKAFWQVYNLERSRAFRELNFEPEMIFNFPVNFNFLGMRGKMLGIALNHQSNGRDIPLSRSWNRIIFHVGLERDSWSLVLRPWIRIHDQDDQNPEITNYIGRAEATFTYSKGKHSFYMIATNSLKFHDNHGGAQFTYEYPIIEHLRAQVQIFTGHGETLMDYNHRQTTLGFGISFVDW